MCWECTFEFTRCGECGIQWCCESCNETVQVDEQKMEALEAASEFKPLMDYLSELNKEWIINHVCDESAYNLGICKSCSVIKET